MTDVFLGVADFTRKLFPSLKLKLLQANIEQDDRQYLASSIAISFLFFLFFSLLLFLVFWFFQIDSYLYLFFTSLIFSFFIFLQRVFRPNIVAMKRLRSIERNLLPALQSIYVQVNSGVVLFEVLVNISKSNYGEISSEFAKVVKEINAGKGQLNAIEDLAARNPSLFFRRAIWQIINGMKAGADISSVLQDIIHSLSEEQVIQIQNYGGRLAPLAMFYMFVAVIIPALSVTFIILFLSFANVTEEAAKGVFYGLYVGIIFSQIMFIGLISSRRPSLL